MGRYLSSYFFPELTLLNTFYFPRQDSIVQSWTDGYISGKKLIDKDIYILTSPNTASAAEAFTYNLKNYKKATIIGEKTLGAAHWVEYFYYPSIKTEIKLPVARPINPITKSNWEKTGIMPDVVIPEYLVYDKAYYLALEKLQDKCTDKSKLNELDWYKRIVSEKLKNEAISKADINDYIGEYEGVSFVLKNNFLFWHQEDNTEFILLPISKDHYVFDDSDDYIVRFVRNVKVKVTGYQLLIKNREENTVHAKKGKN